MGSLSIYSAFVEMRIDRQAGRQWCIWNDKNVPRCQIIRCHTFKIQQHADLFITHFISNYQHMKWSHYSGAKAMKTVY